MAQCAHCNEAISLTHAPGKRPDVVACLACLNPNTIVDNGEGAQCSVVPGVQDMRVAAPPGSLGGEMLRALCKNVDDLPPLPEISLRVMDLMNDEDAAIKDLAHVIRDDAIIAGNVLKMANSAMYGGLSEVTDVVSACSRLGMQTVANVVQTVSARKLFEVGDDRVNQTIKNVGTHAIAVAYCAHDIAVHTVQPQPVSCFVAGLLHDVGKVGLFAAASRAKDGPASTLLGQTELLNEVIESYHTLAGLLVLQSWNLPLRFGTAVYFHHLPDQAPSDETKSLAHIAALANLIAHASGFPSHILRDASPLGSASCEYVGLSDVQLATLRVDLEDRLQPYFEVMAD